MNSTQENGAVKALPAFWYDIPYGYVQLDVYPSAERMEELARQILALPDDVRDRADQVFRLYALVMWEMQKHRVQGCALGLHPDDQGGAAMSVLTVSSVEMPGVNSKAALVTLMSSGAGETAENGIVPVELPCGPGFLTNSVHRATVPGAPSAVAEGEPADAPVWRGMVAIPDSRSSAVIAVQLVTPAVELADDYRNVLLGVARTVSFTDPALATRTGDEPPEPGSAAAAVRSDFG